MATRMTFFLQLIATPAWLALSRADRHRIIAEHVAPVLARHPGVELRWFDAEAFSAAPSDIVMAETDDLTAWTDLIEELRDTPLWSTPFFTVHALVPAIENGFRDYEARTT